MRQINIPRACLLAFCMISLEAPAITNAQEIERDNILYSLPRNEAMQFRAACALGQMPAMQARLASVGLKGLSVGAYCVTILTRIGRDRSLGYVRDRQVNQITPAMAFDSGFVGGYLKREAPPPTAPSITALLPLADRCLDQTEQNIKRCSSVGYILGMRAARGETIPAA